MNSTQSGLQCQKCHVEFTQRSSLTRHYKRCLANIAAPSRRKSCERCADAKVRCNLTRPICSRSVLKGLPCEYYQDTPSEDFVTLPSSTILHKKQSQADGQSLYTETSTSRLRSSMDIATNIISQQSAPYLTFVASAEIIEPAFSVLDGPNLRLPGRVRRSDSTQTQSMNFTIRVLRTYPQMLSRKVLPPFMHPMQMLDTVPPALKHCIEMLARWDPSNAFEEIVVRAEMDRLYEMCPKEDGINLLASLQALTLYAIVLLFPKTPGRRTHKDDQDVIMAFQDITLRLAASGLALRSENEQRVPSWSEWALMAAKRRSILTVYFLTWAWSELNGYPPFHCSELVIMLAPEAKSLWQAQSESEWQERYLTWLETWSTGGYTVGETFAILPQVELDARTETWLEDVDEFGMLLMSQVNAI